jgi:hypothetical protein
MFVFDDNFNFNEELLKDTTNDENTCLISGLPIENPIKLSCGHEFSFEPLFKEVFNQKINPFFKNDIHLKPEQFKCPYCRKIQKKLLPDDTYKIYKVTTNDSDYEIYPDMIYSPNINIFLGNCDYPFCSKKYVVNKKTYNLHLCCIHEKKTKKELLKVSKINDYKKLYPEKSVEDIILKVEADIQILANKTKEEIIIDNKLAKEKAKEEAKLAKEKAKEEAKLAKEKAKEEAKLAKEKAKEEAKLAKEKAKEEAKLAKEKAKEEAKLAKEKAKEEAKLAKEKAKEEFITENAIKNNLNVEYELSKYKNKVKSKGLKSSAT